MIWPPGMGCPGRDYDRKQKHTQMFWHTVKSTICPGFDRLIATQPITQPIIHMRTCLPGMCATP
jgi:hypothetical protein